MGKSANEILKKAKEQNLTSEETKELMIKEGIIIKNNEWISVNDSFPKKEINVLCYHEYSENYFICHRTNDCLTNEEKWFNGALPTHWKHLDKPKSSH